MEFPKNTGINEHTIKLLKNQKPLYRHIYALSLVKLKTLKAYIKTHLQTGFTSPKKEQYLLGVDTMT